MARTHYNQNMRFGKLKGKEVKIIMLENILIEYFNLSREWYTLNKDDKEIEWENAYNNLVELIYALARLGIIENADKIVEELDEIQESEIN